ncbi:MAG TPA: VOC family protein [Longimicrobiales bacterium]|nr:VOC family protein [Longimicrobiales bacterium]
MILHIALLAQLVGAQPQKCDAAPSAPALDHVILLTRDLDSASAAFRRFGFRIKPGRLHANGLLNRHIKFRDGTEIELMTVHGRPRDRMALDYAGLLRRGEGGVYVALKVEDAEAAQRLSHSAGLATRRSASGPWRFLSFPASSPAAAVFFTSGDAPLQDADSTFGHDPEVRAMTEAWIEGGAQLGVLLRSLGAAACGNYRAPDGRIGQRWMLARGSIVIVPSRGNGRPRVLGVVLRSPAQRKLARPLPEFWLQYQ